MTGGRWRGRRLAAPAGARPTSARLREALFSIWSDRLAGAVFVDLFAGSGVVGLEALGRGASRAVLVEGSRAAAARLRAAVESLKASGATVLVGDVERLLRSGRLDRVDADLVYADPPYDAEWSDGLSVAVGRLARPGARLAVERRAGEPLPDFPAGGWRLVDERRYGDAAIGLYDAELSGG